MRRNDQRLKSYASNMKGLATVLLLSNSGIDQPSILPSVQALQQTSATHLKMASSIHSQQSIATRQKSDENTLSLAQSLEASEEFQQQSQKEKIKASTISQETIDAAASVSVDENTRSFTGESIDGLETNLESTDAGSISQTTTQETNLINSLTTTEEGSFENTLEQSDDQASTQFKSSVDTTLDEIRKLRIIDRELANDSKNDDIEAKKKQIDEKGIEESILKKMKSGQSDHGRIETLVQEQIEDQAGEIEATQALQESKQALEYGMMVDTAANESEEMSINELEAAAAQERKKIQEKKIIARELEKQRQAQDSEIDMLNVSHLQSEAAMNDINPTKVISQVLMKTREPIMPSPDSSALDLGEDYAFKSVKPKTPPKKSQQQLIADVLQKSLKIKERDDKAFKEAQSLFKAKKSQKKESKAAKKKEINHEKVLAKKKTEEEIDKENGQLDNLFLTLRESIVENIEEAHISNKTIEQKKDHHSIKSHGKKKHHHKKKVPKNTQMLQLDSDIQMEAASVQQSHMKSGVKSHLKSKLKMRTRARDDDMSPDEMADVELAAMAHNAIGQQRKEENMLSQAKNPYADLVEVAEHQGQTDAGSQPSSTEDTSSSFETDAPANDHQVQNPASTQYEHPETQDMNSLLTGVPSNSEERKALQRQQSIEEAAEQREREMSDLSQPHYSSQDFNSDPAGEVAVEHHFEDSSLKGALEQIETEQTLQRAEYKEPPRVEQHEDEPELIGGDQHQQDKEIQQAIDNINNEQHLSYLENAARPQAEVQHKSIDYPADEFLPTQAVKITKQFMDEHDMEGTLQSLEGFGPLAHEKQQEEHNYAIDDNHINMRNLMDEVSGEGVSDPSFVQTKSVIHQGPPRSVSLLQVESQVEAESQAQAQAQAYAQAQSMIAMRAQAHSQAEAAVEALSALGIQQKSQIQTQDANLINALKRTITQLEAKKNPAAQAAEAKKKAVNNIQKSLTKKILGRLDDSQPLINVFSKMQSLSKMMPQIEDFERRLNILHQVEPILENAINTLSKVVDLNSALPAAPTPKPKPKPKKAAASSPDLGQLKALLAQAQQDQAPAEPTEEETPDLSGLLGGGSGLEGLLGGAAEEPAADPAPEADASSDDLSSLLGAGGGGDTADLLQKLLG